MDFEVTQKLAGQLRPRESLLWSGRPRQGFMLRKSNITLMLIGILVTAFALNYGWYAYKRGAPLMFLLVGAVFLSIGLYLIFGVPVADTLKRRGTYYGITSDRALIVSEWPVRSVRSLKLDDLAGITVTRGADGGGTLDFRTRRTAEGRERRIGMKRFEMFSFELIPEVERAHQTVLDAREKARGHKLINGV